LGNPGVVPPADQYAGLTYGEWGAKWYQWATLLPANNHPLFDTTDFSAGQSAPVWFLGGVFCSNYNPICNPQAVKRSCKIPAGKTTGTIVRSRPDSWTAVFENHANENSETNAE
jgi:hypothetical protein